MNEYNPLQTLRNHNPRFRPVSVAIPVFALFFLAFTLYIGQQRTPEPELFTLLYVGVVIAAVQLPLSFYVWRYLPERMPARITEQMLVSAFRLTMTIALLLCLGVVLFAGLAAVVTGYAYPAAIIGGLAIGAMAFHMPGERRFKDFLR